MTATLDPAVALALRAGFALLFAAAALHKVRRPRDFHAAVAGFGLLPAAVVGPAAASLVAAEIAVVGVLLAWPAAGGMAAAALLLVYAAAMALALARGRAGVDCGCGGPGGGAPLQRGLVVRNLLLAALALATRVPAGARVLGWLDGLTVIGALATAAALFGAVGALLATGPRIAELRRAAEGV